MQINVISRKSNGHYVVTSAAQDKLAEMGEIYRCNRPFQHINLKDALDSMLIEDVSEEVNSFMPNNEKSFFGANAKFTESRIDRLPKRTRSLLEFLNSDEWLRYLSSLVQIPDLRADPGLEGGGIHRTFRGGFLKVHTDFNWNDSIQLYRRINLILFLNKDWQENWGGALELWSRDRESEVKSYLPKINEMVIFGTDENSFHGHPFPLNCPEQISRNSIATYYYTAVPPEEGSHRKRVTTNYQGTSTSTVRKSLFRRVSMLLPASVKRIFRRGRK